MKTTILVLVVLFIVLDVFIYFLHKSSKKEINKEDEESCPPKPLSREEQLEHENTEYTFGHNVHHHYVDGDGNNLV